MGTCEPIRISCPKCGSRYRIEGRHIFNLKQTSCGKCKEILRLPADHLRSRPVAENEILDWLRLDLQE